MKRARLYGGIALAVSLASGAAVMLMLLVGVFGRGDARTDASSSAATTGGSDSGFGEGIKVHGDWVIEVRNADGSLAERREFQNALLNPGSNFLDLTLARNMSVGEWAVALIGAFPPCGGIYCSITEVGGTHNWGTPPEATFPTLQLSTQQNPNQFILQGNFDALSDGDISEVHTVACFSQPPNLNAGACNNTGTFTATTLQAPVNVVAGQQVLVTVRISFS